MVAAVCSLLLYILGMGVRCLTAAMRDRLSRSIDIQPMLPTPLSPHISAYYWYLGVREIFGLSCIATTAIIVFFHPIVSAVRL